MRSLRKVWVGGASAVRVRERAREQPLANPLPTVLYKLADGLERSRSVCWCARWIYWIASIGKAHEDLRMSARWSGGANCISTGGFSNCAPTRRQRACESLCAIPMAHRRRSTVRADGGNAAPLRMHANCTDANRTHALANVHCPSALMKRAGRIRIWSD